MILTTEEQLTPKFEAQPSEYQKIDGMFDFHTLTDNIVSEVPDNGLIVEAGVYKGRFAAFVRELLTYNRPNNGIKQRLIDIFETQRWTDADGVERSWGEFTEIFFIVEQFHWIKPGGRQILADVKFTQDYSHNALRSLDSNTVDMLYVDADHSGWGCYGDITIGAPSLKPGGVVLIHDYHHPFSPEVTSAVDMFVADNPHIEFHCHRCTPGMPWPQNHVVWFRAPQNGQYQIRTKKEFEKEIKKFPVFSAKTKPLNF